MRKYGGENGSHPGDRDADLAFLAWLCALTSLYCALIFVGARVGLEGSLVFPLLCVAILWAAAFSPFLVPHEWRGSEPGRAAIGLISLLLLSGPLLAYWVAPSVFVLYPAIAFTGTVRAWRRVRLACLYEGQLLRAFVTEALEEYLSKKQR